MLQLADGLCLDLPNPLTGHLEDLAHLLKSIGIPISKAVAQLDNLAFPVGKRTKNISKLFLQHLMGRGVDGRDGSLVLDEITEEPIIGIPDRPV